MSMQGGQFFRFPVSRPRSPPRNPAPTRRTRRRRHHRSDAGNSSGARPRSTTRGPQCHALGRFGVSPARTPGGPPRSARGDCVGTSVKVRPHKRVNSLSTFIFSYINAQFAHHYARKGSVPGRFRPPRKGADRKALRNLQLSAQISK